MVLGVWLFFSPETFGYQSEILIWSDRISGILLILFGWWGRRNPYWNWAILMVGLWMQASPLIFWAPEAACYINGTLIGVFVIALSFLVVDPPGTEPDAGPGLPSGWSYNPSSWAQRFPIAVLALLCWMISRYLAAFELGYIKEVWDPFFDQGTRDVLTSSISKAFPVADAGLGALAYTLEFLTTCQGGTRRWRTSPWMVLVFGILVIPVSLTSVLLIISQPLIVGHWCTLCLVTAVLMLIGIPWAIDEVVLVYQFIKKVPKGERWRVFFLGGDCPGSTEDHRSPPMDASFRTLWKASIWGMSFPWNLLCSVIVGLALMVMPKMWGLSGWLLGLDLVLGAFGVVVAVISFAEHTRQFRWMNVLFGAILLAGTAVTGTWVSVQIGLPLLLVLLAIPRGKFFERSTLQ